MAGNLPDEKDTLKPGVENEDDDLEIIVGEGEEAEDDEPEIEVVDDTPPEDRNRPKLSESDTEPTEEEMEAYSEAVQKRIRKETHRYHDERRAREAVQRERDEAIAAAKRLLEEKKALESRYKMGETAYITQSKEKAELSMAAAKRAYKEAYEIGDPDAMADAQEKMALIAAEKREAEVWARQIEQQKQNAGQLQQEVVQSQPSQSAQPSAAEPEAQEWARKNPWFGQDEEMTQFAYGAHSKLVANGLDPIRDSSEYYSRLNARMREVFPNYDWRDAPKKKHVTSIVAPVNRTTKQSKRVTLTQSQLNVAKRLGLTPVQYALEVAKLKEAQQ
jgi:hypothetical protein